MAAAIHSLEIDDKDILSMWKGESSTDINVTFRTKEAMETCLGARSIQLPYGVTGCFLHEHQAMVDVKVHWVPPYISDGYLTEYFESLGRELEIRQLNDERGRHLGVRAVKLQMPKDHLDQLPHVISTDDKDIRFLLTVRGREPKCLGCGANGHVWAECPRTSRPRATTQQRRTTERPATKLTSLGSVPSHQPRPAADDVSLRPQQTPATTKENSTHPDSPPPPPIPFQQPSC